eukprot:Em0016g352a
MDKTDIDSIEYREPRELKEQIYIFFDIWKRTQGRNASISQLVLGLKQAGLSWCLEQMDSFISGRGTCRYEDENDTVIVHTVQPTEPVGIDQPSAHRPKAHSFKDVPTATFYPSRFYSEGARYKIERSRACGTSRSPSLSSHSSTDNIDSTDIIDDQLPIILVFETTGPIDIQTLQHVSIENIALNKFKVRGRILDCCKLLDTLRQKQSRSPRISSKTIPIESQDQWDRVVGTKGCVHKAITKLSGAKVKINHSESYPKMCTIRGFHGQLVEAEKLIERALKGDDIVTEATPENILACLKKDLEMYGAFKFLTES